MKKIFTILFICFSLSVFGQGVLISYGNDLIEDSSFLVGGTYDTISVESTIPVPNTGASGTSDWNDTDLDGMPDYFTSIVNPGTDITTVESSVLGFTGNVVKIANSGSDIVESIDVAIDPTETYYLRVKGQCILGTNSQISATGVDFGSTLIFTNGEGVQVLESEPRVWGSTSTKINLVIFSGAQGYFDEIEIVSGEERIIIY